MKLTALISSLAILNFYTSLCYAQELAYFSNTDRINDLFFEEDKMWVATEGGLLELDLDANLIKKHTGLDGIGDTNIDHIFRGEDNLLFIELENNAIQIYKDGHWVDYDGFKKNTYCSLINNNGLFGYINHSHNKVALYDNEKWKEYKLNVKGYSMRAATILDNDNNLWISYKSGVIKYDGNSSKTYQFMKESYDTPDILLKDKNGNLWATDILDGWYHYDTKTDTWSTCKHDSCKAISASRFAFSDSKQNIWFASRYGDVLYKFDGTDWERMDIPFQELPQRFNSRRVEDRLVCGAEDKAGNIWFGTLHGNLYKYDGVKWTSMNLSQKSTYFVDGDMRISTIHQAEDGEMWIAGWEYISVFNVNGKQHKSFNKSDLKKDAQARFPYTVLAPHSLIEDKEGNIYINPQEGVFKYNKKSEKWQYFMRKMSIKFMGYHEKSSSVYFLNNKGILITETDEGEVIFRHIIQADSNNYIRYDFTHLDITGNLWVKANDTLRCITADSIILFDASNSPIFDRTNMLYEDSKGRIWVNIEGGIAYWDGEKWHSFTKKNSPIRTIYTWNIEGNCLPITEDKNGDIFVQTNKSIYKWNGKKWKTSRNWKAYLKKGTSRPTLYFDTDNNLWIADSELGILKCQGENCQQVLQRYSTNYLKILEDTKGQIWFLTDGSGLFRYTN